MKKISQEVINGIVNSLSDTTIPVNLFKAITKAFDELEVIKEEVKEEVK